MFCLEPLEVERPAREVLYGDAPQEGVAEGAVVEEAVAGGSTGGTGVVRGIELSAEGIRASRANATLNNIPEEKISFIEGDAANIFATVQDFPRDRTVLIIDPPRKGSDERFINQLIQFACQTVVYVSCNVHTQARDVGMILRKSEAEMQGKKYVLESVRGFDLFPQTAHVESVAVLRLVDVAQS